MGRALESPSPVAASERGAVGRRPLGASLADIGAALRPAAWITMGYAVVKTTTDPDLWGHLRFGLDIIRDRALTPIDPYSFTQDLPWVNHEWLSEVVMGLAYLAGGETGLMGLKALLAVATLAVLAGETRDAADELRWPAMTVGALASLPLTLTLRPQLWTWLFLAVLCSLINGPVRRRWWAVVLFVPWVNLHGGWIVGAGIIGLWAVVRAWDEPSERRALAGLLAACSVATLATPYGWHLWAFLASTVRLSREGINEWLPIWRYSWQMMALWAAGTLCVAWTARQVGMRPILAKAAPLGALAGAALWVSRLVPLYVLAALALLAPRWRRGPTARSSPSAKIWIDAGAAAVALVFMLSTGMLPRCVAIEEGEQPDRQIVTALKSAGAAGRLVTSFNWGEYVIWHHGPTLRVSVDGRRETVYSPGLLDQLLAIEGGKGLDTLERLAPDYAWLPLPSAAPAEAWLLAHGYRVDFRTDKSFLAVRAGLPVVPVGQAAASTCFPGS